MKNSARSFPLNASKNGIADLPDAESLISAWLANISSTRRAKIEEVPYRYFWSTWTKYLQDPKGGAGVPWHEVNHEHIAAFLRSWPDGRKQDADVTSTTQRRYWRLLDRIYSYAKSQKWVIANPIETMQEFDVPPPENPKGAILHPKIWSEAISLIGALPGPELVHVRNKALLLVLFYLGLTPEESRAIETGWVQWKDVGGQRTIEALQINGDGVNQFRRLKTPPCVAVALADWLKVRANFPKTNDHSIVFSSPRGSQMTHENLRVLVKNLLVRAVALADCGTPPHMGPQIIRNTRLVLWWREAGRTAQDVAMLAGFKNTKGLGHLKQHVSQDLRDQLQKGLDTDEGTLVTRPLF